jgi:hypothetical protein
MKLLPTICAASMLLAASAATAQQPRVPKTTPPVPTLPPPPSATHFTPPSLSAPTVTPELWIYSQELRRHDDPAQAVRRKAEINADQRLMRLAALKWYGMSNSRPDASAIPLMGGYSPAWIGNGWNRYDWTAVGAVPILVR